MAFIIATNNEHKLFELKKILIPLGIDALSAKEANVNLLDVEETGTTFEENAKLKAEAAFKLTGMPSIADDSGLEVDALNGEPGIYSSRYSGKDATDQKNIDKLLEKLKNVPDEKRTARFVCTICCILPSKEYIFVRGTVEGKIAFSKKGESGFGYDPIFITESGKSFAELSPEEKNSISHRGNALRILSQKLKDKLKKDNEEI